MRSPKPSAGLSVKVATVVIVAAVALVSCRSSSIWFRLPTDVLPPERPPSADTPVGVVRALEWSFNHRDTVTYRTLFTSDYRFRFAQADSAGSSFPDRMLTRAQELQFARAAFVLGTPHEPPPVAISLTLSGDLVAQPDSRPDKDGRVHREIAAQTLLRLLQPDFLVTGVSRFFVVRGDSAVWPEGLAHAGADSTRWFIEFWDDETIPSSIGPSISAPSQALPGDRTQPSRNSSFGQVKALWLLF
jgi:hypothetical protein